MSNILEKLVVLNGFIKSSPYKYPRFHIGLALMVLNYILVKRSAIFIYKCPEFMTLLQTINEYFNPFPGLCAIVNDVCAINPNVVMLYALFPNRRDCIYRSVAASIFNDIITHIKHHNQLLGNINRLENNQVPLSY